MKALRIPFEFLLYEQIFEALKFLATHCLDLMECAPCWFSYVSAYLTYTSIEIIMTNRWIDINNFRRWN
jgi:hypothetical protein